MAPSDIGGVAVSDGGLSFDLDLEELLVDLSNDPKDIRCKHQIFKRIERHIRNHTRKYPNA